MSQPVFHPLEGRADCLSCHEHGADGAPEAPVTHLGWSSETCGSCHTPAVTNSVAVYPLALPLSLFFALGVMGFVRTVVEIRLPPERER